jgi:hypothetical protein
MLVPWLLLPPSAKDLKNEKQRYFIPETDAAFRKR